MAVIRVPVEMVWPGPGSPGVNIWHVRTTLEESFGADLQLMVDALRAFYVQISGNTPSGTTFKLGQVVDVQTKEIQNPSWETVVSAAVGGSAPQALQVCVSWRTSIAARRGMGRTFIGPLASQVMQSDGSIAPEYLAGIESGCQTLLNASQAAANGAIAIWGLQNPAPVGTTNYAALPHVARDITAFSIKDKFAVLRSRRD